MVVGMLLATGLACGSGLCAGENADPEVKVREILVPFDDLNVLLEGQTRRVMLSRDEYQALVKKAQKTPDVRAPKAALLVAADYTATIDRQQASLEGTLVVDVLEDGLHAVPLDLGGVALRTATLDGHDAPIGPGDGGRPSLLVEGVGRHELVLRMMAPLRATAARQTLQFRLPRPAATRMQLTVPGDVELKSGADLSLREVDTAAGVTRFELLPPQGDATLVMTLNSRLRRTEQAVVARSVLVDEVTESYERLHATVSMEILHRAVDRFRFALPDGFEVTQVDSPLLARWDVESMEGTEETAGRRVLNVRLQEPTNETVVFGLSAIKTRGAADAAGLPRAWRFPKLEPLDVVGHVAVVGLLVEQRLEARSIAAAADELIPIDVAVLARAMPQTALRAEPGTPPLRPVVAYYAPRGEFALSAELDKPAAELAVTANLLLILGDGGQEVRGGLAVLPRQEKLFAVDFTAPAGWDVDSVTDARERPLAFERFDLADGTARVHVRLPAAVAMGATCRVYFHATRTPPGWLGDWAGQEQQVAFPEFAVVGAASDQGAIAVAAHDDLTVRPADVGLTPLDESEYAKNGLAGVALNLAYRYETPGYRATLAVGRTESRLTAETYSLLRIEPGALSARYELIYDVQQARTQRLALLLPASTPETLSIRGLDGVKLKEYQSEPVEIDGRAMRRWNVQLEEARRGTIRLAVDFQQPLAESLTDYLLPLVAAAGARLARQSGLVAVEGSAELDVAVKTAAARADVGELAEAEYRPGRRLLGVYRFVGTPQAVSVDVALAPGYALPSAVVERAELHTYLSANGVSQTQATLWLRTKALYLAAELPPGSELWAVWLDRTPLKPQRDGAGLLVSLPAAEIAGALRNLEIVYATQLDVPKSGKYSLPAPRLLLRGGAEAQPVEVPMADLLWHVHLPSGYEIVQSGGTVVPVAGQLPRPRAAAFEVAGALYWLAGGSTPLWDGFSRRAKISQPGAESWTSAQYYMTDDASYDQPDVAPDEAPAATPPQEPAARPAPAPEPGEPSAIDKGFPVGGQSESVERILAALKSPTEMNFDKAPLPDVVDFLKRRHNIEIQIDRRALENVGYEAEKVLCTKRLDGISLRSALKLMLRDEELTYMIADEVLLITTPEEAQNCLDIRVYPVADLVTYRDEKGVWTDFQSLIDTLVSTVDALTWEEAGGPGSMGPDPLYSLLVVSQTQEVHEHIAEALARLRASSAPGGPGGRLSLRLRPAPGRTPAATTAAPVIGQSEAARRIDAALASPAQFTFGDTSLPGVVDFLKGRYHIEIQIDRRALEDVGIEASGLSITKAFEGISLRSALRLMLRDLELTYVVQDEVLLITTPEEAQERPETKAYPVADLVTTPTDQRGQIDSPDAAGFVGGGTSGADFDSLIECIVSTVEPLAWDEAGGPGSVAPFGTNLSVVISNTQEVHEEISGLMETLRTAKAQTELVGEPPLSNRPASWGTGGMGMGGMAMGGWGGMGSGMGNRGGQSPFVSSVVPGMGGTVDRESLAKGVVDQAYQAERSHVPFPNEPPIAYPDSDAWRELAGRQLQGVRSLPIDLDRAAGTGPVVTFRSLGAEPVLEVTLASRFAHCMAGWGLALAVGLVGLARTGRSAGCKARFVVVVGVLATLVPLLVDSTEVARAANMVFYAASLLVPYYLAVGLVRWFAGLFRRRPSPPIAATAATTAAVLLLAAIAPAARAAAPANQSAAPYVIQVVPPPAPVNVPDDAILLPYDPASPTGIRDADKLLVPYDRYVELWNRANPDEKIQTERPPVPYALAGAAYTATLEGDDYLLLRGRLTLEVYTDDYVTVPLRLTGGVLAQAELDGKPARLREVTFTPVVGQATDVPASQQATQTSPQPPANQVPSRALAPGMGMWQQLEDPFADDPFADPQQTAVQPVDDPFAEFQRSIPPPSQPTTQTPNQPADQTIDLVTSFDGSLLSLYVAGKGRHELVLAVRMRLGREGGWRVAEGVLPAAPATALTLTVPQAQTELRLGGQGARRDIETAQSDETIETALGSEGAVAVRWRPQVAEGQVDRSLTAHSTAVFDVQEDGLRLLWQLQLEFGSSQRDEFRVGVPAGYLLEKIDGPNVRGWRRDQQRPETIDVELLQPAKDNEQFTLHLWRKGPMGQAGSAEFEVPCVAVADAALHDGQLVVRRSPLLDLRTLDQASLSRIDLGGPAAALAAASDQESPLGIRPYQAYRFLSSPFTLRLAASPVAAKLSAAVQTVLKVAEYERTLESRIVLTAENRSVHLVEVLLPADLTVTEVSAPGQQQWTLTEQEGRERLSIVLATGQRGELPVLVRGTLGERGPIEQLALPAIEVLGVERQTGEIAVQLDPAYDVRAEGLENCRTVLLRRLNAWLDAGQQRATRLGLEYERPDYRGALRLVAREPEVTCETITNVRVTDRAVEETILVEASIRNAGIREFAFRLPAGMEDCRIQVPLLRQKRIEPTDQGDLRVWIELQDAVMDQLRVLVENDRPLVAKSYSAPIPSVEQWPTTRRYVALEGAGGDEVVVDATQTRGLEPISRQQTEWARLRSQLGDRITQAYLVAPGADDPRLVFRTETRQAVETVGAAIGLARTVLVVDAAGAYRAAVTYRLDNATEQFLEIELPEDAALWAARVAGEPVKPARVAGAAGARLARIPLVKTAPGDLDYAVEVVYGGRMPALESLAAADFPLVHTKNINVALSQVELYVPKTHRLFGFGGTMGRVGEEADLTAGYVAYASKKAERLIETIRSEEKWASSRSAYNLKQKVAEMHRLQASESRADNANLQAELEANKEVLRRAEAELEKYEKAGQPGSDGALEVGSPNRFQMNDLYTRQDSSRATNVVQQLGRNWKTVAKAPAAEADREEQFDGKWLEGNQLDSSSSVAQTGTRTATEDSRDGQEEPADQPVEFGKRGAVNLELPAQPSASSQPAAPEVAQGMAKARLAASGSSRSELGDQNGRQDIEIAGGTFRLGVPQSGGYSADDSFAMSAEVAQTPEPAATPTGLASLELQLPEHDGDFYQAYLFTTPRGEVRLTAWTVSDGLLRRVLGLAALVVVVVVLVRLARRARAGGLAWLASPASTTLMIGVGLIAVLLGILPVAGLAAVVAGIVLKVKGHRKRRPAMAR